MRSRVDHDRIREQLPGLQTPHRFERRSVEAAVILLPALQDLRKLGNPTGSKINGVTKEMSYRDLNIEIWLTKEEVYMLALRDPSHQR